MTPKAERFVSVDIPGVRLEPLFSRALAESMGSLQPAYQHLPLPVQLRASGALAAWQRVVDQVPVAATLRETLGDVRRPVPQAYREAMAMLDGCISTRDPAVRQFLDVVLSHICLTLLFWWRAGALLEPTVPLGMLLGATDWARDLPLRCLQMPAAALCILPPWQQRHACGDMQAIYVYSHEVPPSLGPGTRALTFVCSGVFDGGRRIEGAKLSLVVHAEEAPIEEALQRAMAITRENRSSDAGESEAEIREEEARWRQILDYVVKVLLYLDSEHSAVRHLAPYSAAPKEFPGLGKRKRAEKLAEVEQLYDRYIVGPATLSEAGLSEGGKGLSKHGEVGAHWRRGHFRLQAHGPKSALRKVLFVAPTIVRADRLAQVGEVA
jgi:hypothetical protein